MNDDKITIHSCLEVHTYWYIFVRKVDWIHTEKRVPLSWRHPGYNRNTEQTRKTKFVHYWWLSLGILVFLTVPGIEKADVWEKIHKTANNANKMAMVIINNGTKENHWFVVLSHRGPASIIFILIYIISISISLRSFQFE